MSTDNEVCQIDGEHALHDVLHIICKYARGKDLCNMAQVCKSWNYAALREKIKRYYIHQLHLSFPYFSYVHNFGIISSKVDLVPSTSLVIYESKFGQNMSLSPCYKSSAVECSEKLLEYFKQQLPNKTIVLGVDEYLSTELPGFFYKSCYDLDMLGLFFPSLDEQIRVHVGWCLNRPTCLGQRFHQNALVNHLSEELGLNDCKYAESTMLMFATGGMTDYLILEELYKRAQKNDKKVTFALSNGAKICAGNCRSNQQSILVLRFSGPAVDSWATHINSRASIFDIWSKLEKLKEKVSRGRFCIGLIFGPKCEEQWCSHMDHPCCGSEEMMGHLKYFFPDIPFTGLFTKADSNAYKEPEDYFYWQFKEIDRLSNGKYKVNI